METTPFQHIYNCFLSKITDDMYIELTPEDTYKDCQNLLKNNLIKFEFPRFKIFDYTLSTVEEVITDESIGLTEFVDKSYFNSKLTEEEINILALIMMEAWLGRQIASIEYTRMKYFKTSSQANQLSKLLTLQESFRKENIHMQRLYRRRKITPDGEITSNWSSIMEKRVIQ